MRNRRAFRSGLWTAFAAVACACGTVDLGEPPADVTACRPSERYFAQAVWAGFLNKDFGGKRCGDARCHDATSGQSLVVAGPMGMPTVPLSRDWGVVYRSVTEQLSCSNPSGSALLLKPDGRTSHGGKQLFAPDGPEATLIRMWVAAP